MKSFYQDFGIIIGFLILTLVVNMVGGEKATKWHLYLVLFGMIILNADTFTTFLKGAFKKKETIETDTDREKQEKNDSYVDKQSGLPQTQVNGGIPIFK